MRLIDADRLDGIMQDVEQYFRQTGFSDGSLPLDICKMIVEAVLNKSPTVDAVPVVHGRWIDNTKMIQGFPDYQFNCSKCYFSVWHPMLDITRYYPNCGAKMDEPSP